MGAPIGKPAEGKDPVGCSVMLLIAQSAKGYISLDD